MPRVRFRVQPRRSQPPEGSEGVHGGQLRIRYSFAQYAEEVQERLPGDDKFFNSGHPCRTFRRFRVREEQEGRGGTDVQVRRGNRGEGARVSLPEPLRKVVPPELQLRDSNLLQQHRQRPAHHGERPRSGTGGALHRRPRR